MESSIDALRSALRTWREGVYGDIAGVQDSVASLARVLSDAAPLHMPAQAQWTGVYRENWDFGLLVHEAARGEAVSKITQAAVVAQQVGAAFVGSGGVEG